MVPPCCHMGLLGYTEAYPPTWQGLMLCVGLGTTFVRSEEANCKSHPPLPVVSLRILCFSCA